MPPRIQNVNTEIRARDGLSNTALHDLEDVEPYDYGAAGLPDLTPGTHLHDMLVDELNTRIEESFEERKRRFPTMRSMDNLLSAFIEQDDYEKSLKDLDSRKPTSIVMPVTYAAFGAISTHILSAMAALESLNPLRPTGPEDLIGTAASEKILDLQSSQSDELLTRYYMATDSLRYGYGACITEWVEEGNYVDEPVPVTQANPQTGEPESTGEYTTVAQWAPDFIGNKSTKLDPYLLLTEPNVHITETHKMEYVGYGYRTNRMRCLTRERRDPKWINARYIKYAAGEDSPFTDVAIQEVDSYTATSDPDESTEVPSHGSSNRPKQSTNLVHEFVLFVNLVPSEWRARKPNGEMTALGPSEYPEWWVFGIAGGQLITRAGRLSYRHGRPPISIVAPESDGDSSDPIGLLEVTRGCQEIIDYRINLYNAMVRRFFRGRWLAAEDAVNLRDLYNNEEIIRLSRVALASGGSVDKALQPIAFPNPYGGSTLNDNAYMQDIVQRALGATEPLQGVLQAKGERRSAEEAFGARAGALNRIERMVTLMSFQAFKRMTLLKLRNLQQFQTEEMYIRVAGRWMEELAEEHNLPQNPGKFVSITPDQLQVHADVEALDATRGGTQDTEAMTQLFQAVASNPALMQAFDVVRMFKNVARMSGMQNVNDFALMSGRDLSVKVQQDEEAMRAMDKEGARRV